MDEDEPDSITDAPDDAPSPPVPLHMRAPIDQALMSRPRGNPIAPQILDQNRRIDTTLSSDPANIPRNYEGAAKDAPLEPGLVHAHGAMERLHNAWHAIAKAAGDRTIDNATLAGLSEKAMRNAVAAADAAGQKIAQRIAALDAEIQTRIAPAQSESLSVAICQHWRGVSSRFADISAAVRAGDQRTSAAVLGLPAYLSGLDGRQLALVRDQAVLTFAPEQKARRDACVRAAQHLSKAGARLVETIGPRLHAWTGNKGGDVLAALQKAAQ